jgi:hypothetical protein
MPQLDHARRTEICRVRDRPGATSPPTRLWPIFASRIRAPSGGVSKRSKDGGCKPSGSAFAGSTPASPINRVQAKQVRAQARQKRPCGRQPEAPRDTSGSGGDRRRLSRWQSLAGPSRRAWSPRAGESWPTGLGGVLAAERSESAGPPSHSQKGALVGWAPADPALSSYPVRPNQNTGPVRYVTNFWGASGALAQGLRLRQLLQLLQRVRLDLPDPLAGDAESPAHLLEGERLMSAQPIAKLDHLALPRG